MAGEARSAEQGIVTPGVVFDCMVFVQALANDRGPAHACYELVRAGKLTLYVSPDTLAELTDVFNRPKLLRKLPSLTPESTRAFLEDIERRAIILSDVPQAVTLDRDPKDEPYLNLAAAAGARFLVSRDLDLLDLMADPAFRRQYPILSIIDPAALLKSLPPDSGTDPDPAS
jgi:putative PIN family toxin of toxin-antitoxin system